VQQQQFKGIVVVLAYVLTIHFFAVF